MDPSASLATLQDNCFSVLLIMGMFYKALSFWAKVVELLLLLRVCPLQHQQLPVKSQGPTLAPQRQTALQFHIKM